MSFDLKIVNGDIQIGAKGDMDIVFDNDKLRQDIIKILLTKLGENKFHPQYGSEIGALQIGQVVDKEFLELDLKSAVEGSLRKIISLQNDQRKKQILSPGEVIVDILDVSVFRDTIDPRLWNIFISVLTQKLTTLTETLSIRIL